MPSLRVGSGGWPADGVGAPWPVGTYSSKASCSLLQFLLPTLPCRCRVMGGTAGKSRGCLGGVGVLEGCVHVWDLALLQHQGYKGYRKELWLLCEEDISP